jgi:predicted nucleic acid-binding Zn ribbon protein
MAPLYEFHCRQCQARVPRIQKPEDPPPACCGEPMTSVLHPPALRFRGPGFHETDYPKRKAK